MQPTPVTRQLQPLLKTGQSRTGRTTWSRLLAELTDGHFLLIALFCAVGLLVTANLIVHFPAIGGVMLEYSAPPL